MGRRIACGDIHGNFKALQQCFSRSKFDYDNDTLIQLGDIVDGWSETFECVEELLKVKWLIPIAGNHDWWFKKWYREGVHEDFWLSGGYNTLISYSQHAEREVKTQQIEGAWRTNLTTADIPKSHIKFFDSQMLYYVTGDGKCFVHGGFNRHYQIEEQMPGVLCWDRDLWGSALSFKSMKQDKYKFKNANNFVEIFIGHTSTRNWDTTEPMHAANIWNLDTGAGWGGGKLTFMDVDTKEYWQSDPGIDLYTNEKGRD